MGAFCSYWITIRKMLEGNNIMLIRITNGQALQARFEYFGRGDSFSNEGFDALFDYLEETLGEDYELDVIAIDSEITEYTLDSLWNDFNNELKEFAEDNGLTPEDLEDLDEKVSLTEEFLSNNTSYVTIEQPNDQPDSYLVAAF